MGSNILHWLLCCALPPIGLLLLGWLIQRWPERCPDCSRRARWVGEEHSGYGVHSRYRCSACGRDFERFVKRFPG